jgi:hypothetical protein
MMPSKEKAAPNGRQHITAAKRRQESKKGKKEVLKTRMKRKQKRRREESKLFSGDFLGKVQLEVSTTSNPCIIGIMLVGFCTCVRVI